MKKGFTLIELLIVVAIIAILAAIAVPNFMEAQTRAKISRVKSDLRTIATAIESYQVDRNRIPFDGVPGGPHFGWVNAQAQLTTPIAYVTTVFADVFHDPKFPDTDWPGHTHFLGDPKQGRHAYDYGTAYWHGMMTTSDPSTLRYAKNFSDSFWKIGSCGPDLTFDDDGGNHYGMQELYDPTNGTSSDGDVYRSMRGQL